MESRLGRYKVLKHLASGGMADVLLARADGIEGFERHVVLKRIRPDHARDQRFIRMFLDEARVAANLHHQHIVQVHDIGEANGEYFIAMEYIHGEDVRSILSAASKRRAHVPLGLAVAIASAAAAGLHYAHERRGSDKRSLGIVHRDISPSNIHVGYDGSIKLLDFGIAKAAMRQETRSGSLKGKISYMSPEQCKGTSVDRRGDVYSLGVVLYELTTTTRLFKGESDYVVMEQIVNGRVSPPHARRPDLPAELSAIIMKAIAVDPERRYFTADEMRVALEQFTSKAGLSATTSAIGVYLRKLFGDRPEPWLELEAQGIYSFDDLQQSPSQVPSNSWTELPRGDEPFQNSSSLNASMLLPLTAPPVTGSGLRDKPPTHPPAVSPAPPAARPSSSSSSASMTESKMAWESQRPPSRMLTPRNVALACVPLILVLVVAIWRLSVSRNEAANGAANEAANGAAKDAKVAATQPAPPTAPAPTPITPPPPATEPAPTAVVTEPVRQPEPTIRQATPSEREAVREREAREREAVRDRDRDRDRDREARARNAQPKRVSAAAKSSEPAPPPEPEPAPVVAPPAPTPAPVVQAPPPPAPAPVAPPVTVPAPAPPPPPVTVTAPTTVANLDANRIAGNRDILPDDSTRAEIIRAGADKVVGSFKVCITTAGLIDTVTVMKSTGYSGYDNKIQSTIRSKWRYKPFVTNGNAQAVCTAVRFIYSQR